MCSIAKFLSRERFWHWRIDCFCQNVKNLPLKARHPNFSLCFCKTMGISPCFVHYLSRENMTKVDIPFKEWLPGGKSFRRLRVDIPSKDDYCCWQVPSGRHSIEWIPADGKSLRVDIPSSDDYHQLASPFGLTFHSMITNQQQVPSWSPGKSLTISYLKR